MAENDEGIDEIEESAEEQISPADELLDDQADAAEDFIAQVLTALDLEGEAVADIEGEWIYVEVTGPEMGVLIGREGATLEALQELTRAAVQQKTSAFSRLMVDIEGYRDRQQSRLEREARSAAARVIKEGEAYSMDPMSSYERKLVHDTIAEIEGVTTSSEGEGPDRHVVVFPA